MKIKFNKLNLFYLPALLIFLVFLIYPLIRGFYLSFTNWNGYSSGYSFVGITNFVGLFSDNAFKTVLLNTFLYGFGSTFVQQVLGLGLALLLNNSIRGKNLFRGIIYLPALVSPIVMGFMYYLMFKFNNGSLNDILNVLGIQSVDWLSNPSVARFVIVIVNSFQFVGISMIIYLAGLQSIPKYYYEASSLDGANKFQQFLHITFPLLAPSITTSVVLNLIGGFKLYDIIMALTGGGPGFSTNSISTYIGFTYFRDQLAGVASAQGVILFLIIAVFTLALNKLLSSRIVEQD